MARQLSGREKGLLFVLAALVLIVGFVYRDSLSELASGAAEPVKFERPQLGIAPKVRLAMLSAKSVTYDEKGRDLFAYAQRPKTRAELEEERRRREEALRRQRELDEQARRAREAAEARRAETSPGPGQTAIVRQPPKFSGTYLGYLGPKDGKIAVFQQGKELLLARAGEVVEDRFVIKDIKYEVVVIGYTDQEYAHKTTELRMPKAR